MAESDELSHQTTAKEAESGKSESKDDKPTPLKNITQIVAILATVSGIAFTAMQLRQKALSDEEASRNAVTESKIKMQIAEDQLDEQRDARKAQDHSKEEEFKEAKVKFTREHLAPVITGLFSGSGGTEGNLSVLFSYLHTDPESRQVVTQAVVARLYTPRSRSEVDLGIRLLEDLGDEAITELVNVNRRARKALDEYSLQELEENVYARAKRESMNTINTDSKTSLEILQNVADSSDLPSGYVCASTLNDLMTWQIYARKPTPVHGDLKEFVSLYRYELSQTNKAIADVITQATSTARTIDLSGTFLDADVLNVIATSRKPLNLQGAYVPPKQDLRGMREIAGKLNPAFANAVTYNTTPRDPHEDDEALRTTLPSFCYYKFVPGTWAFE